MPDPRDILIDKLFVYDPAFSRSIADIYLGNAPQAERNLQKLIIVVEFPRSAADHGALLDAIINTTVKAFEESRQFTPELVLETTLESLNILLPHIAPKKNTQWLNSLNLLIGVSDRGQVHFSQIGNIQAYLVQGSTMTLISESDRQLNPLKLFSHITSGILNPGDAIIMTTSSLGDYIAQEKINSIVRTYAPQAAAQKLEMLVSQVPSSITFAAALIKFTTEYDGLAAQGMQEVPATAAQRDEQPSYDDLIDNTNAGTFEEMPRQRRTLRPRESLIPYISISGSIRWFLKHLRNYLQLMTRILIRLWSAIWAGLQALLFTSKRSAHEKNLIDTTNDYIQQWQMKLSDTPKRKRYTIISLAVLCFLLMHVLLIKGQNKELASIRSSYDTTLFALTQKKSAADDAILYGDEATAEQIYLDMIKALDSLKPANKKQEEQIAQYRKDAEYQLNKVRHINTIDSPLSLADISSIPETNVTAIALAPDGSVMLSADKQLYRLTNGALSKASLLQAPIAFLAQSGDTTLAMTDAGDLFRIKGSDLAQVALQKHADMKKIDAVTLYAGNLYLLDRTKGELFKHEGSGTTFKAGTVWLNDAGLLNKANNVAIDGNAYLITKDGEIVKLLKGTRQEFNYHQFSPQLGASSTIYTTKESKLLYILDPENKRVAILDKQGNIKDQYTSPKFDDLKTLVVTAQEDQIDVLNGKAIYLLAIKK